MSGQKLGHQIKSEKNLVYARGYIFCQIIIKHGQYVFLDEI